MEGPWRLLLCVATTHGARLTVLTVARASVVMSSHGSSHVASAPAAFAKKPVCAREAPQQSYNFSLSTKDNYCDPTAGHHGRFASIRAALDVEYHGMYTVQRQALQDKLITETLRDVRGGKTQPWIIFTAGAMGSGKSHVFNWMTEKGILPLWDVQIFDSDMFKSSLPEWQGYLRSDPAAAGYHTRHESGYLVEIAQEASLLQRKHVWVDGSLRDGEWYEQEFARIRRDHPWYQIAILYVVASHEAIMQRVKRRAEITGRHVPEAEILDSLRRVPRSVEMLSPHIDFLAVADNSADDNTPHLVSYCDSHTCRLGDDGGWEHIFAGLADHEYCDCRTEDEGCAETGVQEWRQIGQHFDSGGSFLLGQRG